MRLTAGGRQDDIECSQICVLPIIKRPLLAGPCRFYSKVGAPVVPMRPVVDLLLAYLAELEPSPFSVLPQLIKQATEQIDSVANAIDVVRPRGRLRVWWTALSPLSLELFCICDLARNEFIWAEPNAFRELCTAE